MIANLVNTPHPLITSSSTAFKTASRIPIHFTVHRDHEHHIAPAYPDTCAANAR